MARRTPSLRSVVRMSATREVAVKGGEGVGAGVVAGVVAVA
jgi:hypothetical protein